MIMWFFIINPMFYEIDIYIFFIYLSLWFQVMKCMTMIYAVKCYVLFLWYGKPMLRGRSSLWYTTDICIMKSQLPGMPVATCSDSTRDLLWCWPRPHHHVILCRVHTHDHGPLSIIYVLTMNYVLKFEMIFNMFSYLLDALNANDFRKSTTYRIYIYIYTPACGFF